MDGIGIFDIANIYSPVGESTGRSQGRKDPPGSGIASDALGGVRSVKKCLVPKRQGGTPRLRLALRDGADAPLQCLPLVGCDRPGNA